MLLEMVQAIRIRGLGSLSLTNSPLIVLDGLPLNDGGVGGSRNPLNMVSPNDIESMVILKDASATAIYGSTRCKWCYFNYY